MLEAVLFDIDGTLVDSNDAHARAWVRAYAEAGYSIEFTRVRRMVGMGGDRIVATLVAGMSDEHGAGKQISERRKEIFLAEEAPSLRPTPGARALVEAIRERGLKRAIATSAKPEELQAILRGGNIEDLFDTKTTSGDADESKPAPDIVSAALKKAHITAETSLMLGDTPYDVEAARRAGVAIVAVRCGGWGDEDLRDAVATYDDPADVLRNLDSLLERQHARR
jgi:HAD superfamily hydrolase (TIGR01509 family)